MAAWLETVDHAMLQAEAEAEEKAEGLLTSAQLSYDEVFKARHQEETERTLDWHTLQRDVHRVRSRYRRANRCILDPRGRFMQSWDIVTLVALMFTVVITPCVLAQLQTHACMR